MKFNTWFVAPLSFVFLLPVLPAATAQDVEIVAAELGGVSVVSVPQPSPLPGLLATKVVLRTAAENKLVTFENVMVAGAVHQVWVPHLPTPTPIVFSWLPPEWSAVDSHSLISPSMVAGGGVNSPGGIGEENDFGNQAGANESLPLINGVAQAVTGIGDIAMGSETDSFSLLPEFQRNESEFAYISTPAVSTGAAGEVFLTVGVSGEGIINFGEPGGASFGFNGNDPVVIPFVPEPNAAALAMLAVLATSCLRPRTLP